MASTSSTNEIQKSRDSRDEKDAEDVVRMRKELIKSFPSNWENVVKIYKQDPRAHKMTLGKSGNTALHMAVANGQEDVVEQLVNVINERSENALDVLSIKAGDWKNTPLHLAASLGSIGMCKCIIGDKHKQLLGTRNKASGTPMFEAAFYGKKDTFLWLYEMCDSSAQAHDYCHAADGVTVLQSVIENGYWDLAFQIIHRLEGLMDSVSNSGSTPLHQLALAPAAFRSGINLSFFQKIIYSCKTKESISLHLISKQGHKLLTLPNVNLQGIYVEELIPETSKEKKKVESLWYPNNYETCINFFRVPWKMIKLLVTGGKSVPKSNKQLDAENPKEGQGHHSGTGAQGHQGFPSPYVRCLNFLGLILSKLVDPSIILPGSREITTLKEIKEAHIWSVQIMNKLLEHAVRSECGMSPQNDETSEARCYSEYEFFRRGKASWTPIILAAQEGVIEMVEKILQLFPMTIHDRDITLKNIVLVAVANRQSHIYDFLLRRRSDIVDKDLAFRERDWGGNSALHIAAGLYKSELWLFPTSMLQLQWEAKWYEYVKNTLPPNFYSRQNNNRKNAVTIFEETHKELLQKSKEWLSNTCNSCSFIAALISTVAFASSATVPGGINQDTGEPIFQHHLTFRLFAISSLVALCYSFISLLFFFAILTSKYHYEDFTYNLPRNLILGLTSLFISMVAMLLCFCSGHFLMLDNHLKYAAIPVYVLTFLAVTYFALQQFPSYFVHLIRATFQKVPHRIYRHLRY